MQHISDLRTGFHSRGSPISRPLMHPTDVYARIMGTHRNWSCTGNCMFLIGSNLLARIFELLDAISRTRPRIIWITSMFYVVQATVQDGMHYFHIDGPCDRCKPGILAILSSAWRNELLAHSRNRINHQLTGERQCNDILRQGISHFALRRTIRDDGHRSGHRRIHLLWK